MLRCQAIYTCTLTLIFIVINKFALYNSILYGTCDDTLAESFNSSGYGLHKEAAKVESDQIGRKWFRCFSEGQQVATPILRKFLE